MEVWIVAGALGVVAGWTIAAAAQYWHGRTLDEEFQRRFRDAANGAQAAREQTVNLINEIDDAERIIRNLREELDFAREMEAQQRHLAQLMHSRTELPDWAELRERSDEIGARLREIDEAAYQRASKKLSQNAE